MSKKITVAIPTLGRYDSLSCTLLSLAFQTDKRFDVIIVDDNPEPFDIRNIRSIETAFRLFDEYKIGWEVLFGRKMGQHHSHQLVQERAKTDWIFRIDDDCVAEPNVIELLYQEAMQPHRKIGAVGPLVHTPPVGTLPVYDHNPISNINAPNIQWFDLHKTHPIQVDHLNCTFLYRKGVASYELALSPAAHREESLFTYSIKRAGYEVLVLPTARVWHFRNPQGGIRSHQDVRFWEQDDKLFQSKLAEWGVNCEPSITVVLDCGAGDHVVLKSLLPELKAKYKSVIIAACFPDIFQGDEVPLISIAEAQSRLGNIDRFNIYRSMIDWNWQGPLENAFRRLYGIEKNSDSTLCQETKGENATKS